MGGRGRHWPLQWSTHKPRTAFAATLLMLAAPGKWSHIQFWVFFVSVVFYNHFISLFINAMKVSVQKSGDFTYLP